MKFYSLLEEIRRGSEAKAVRDALLDKYPKKYASHSSGNRVKNLGNVSADEFRKSLEEVVKDLGLEISKTEIIPPGRGANIKSQSDSFNTIHVSMDDANRDDFGIILASLAGRTKTSTIFKEGMVCFFFGTPDEYEPFKKGNEDTESQYFSLIERIYSDINENGITGLNNKDIIEIKEFLQNKSIEYDSGILNSILTAMSIGNWLKKSLFSNWQINRDKIFYNLKKTGANVTGMPEDKWNPMDIVLIKDEKSENEIKDIIQSCTTEKNKERSLGKLNRIFINNIDSNSDDNPIALAISLKESESQHGRAKSYIDSLDVSNKTQYNLSDDEKLWRNNPEKILGEIIKLRNIIDKTTDNKIYDYRIGGGDLEKFTGQNPLAKYGALKMTQFFIDYSIKNPDIFASLASYGLSLGVNPTFFKLIGNSDGKYESVKHEKFDAEGGVVLYDGNDINYDGKIWIIDNPGNSGIQLVYWVVFAGWAYYTQIQIRSSKGPHQITQVDVEIEKFHKIKEL